MPARTHSRKMTVLCTFFLVSRGGGKKGVTLLEVLAALVIFTVGVVAVVGLFAQGLTAGVDAENTTIAATLARQRLEELRNLDFDTGIVSETKAGVAGFAGFQRQVTVTTPQTDLKQVTATTYWTAKGGEVTVPLTTYLSRN